MIDSLRSRGKILGMAMGEVVLAQIEENQIPVYSYLADLTPIVEKLDKVCYNFLEKPPYS
jgi:hypothetical protein